MATVPFSRERISGSCAPSCLTFSWNTLALNKSAYVQISELIRLCQLDIETAFAGTRSPTETMMMMIRHVITRDIIITQPMNNEKQGRHLRPVAVMAVRCKFLGIHNRSVRLIDSDHVANSDRRISDAVPSRNGVLLYSNFAGKRRVFNIPTSCDVRQMFSLLICWRNEYAR